MASFGLIAHRSIEDLVLDNNEGSKIPGKFVQYMFSHQIQGLRFLSKSCKTQKSCILNDEAGLGKCFPVIAFLNTIVHNQKTKNMLIVCRDKDRVLHWLYHLELLTDGMTCLIADNTESEEIFKGSDSVGRRVVIGTLGYISRHLDTFLKIEYACIILDDKNQEISSDEFEKLSQLHAIKKIMVCCLDVMANLRYFYMILKFCDQTQPLAASQNENTLLNVREFGKKYGSTDDDKSLSQRSIILRQKNLLNMCKEFYLRRFRHQYSLHLPLIDPGTFQRHFDRWALAYCDTEPYVEETSPSQDYQSSEDNQQSQVTGSNQSGSNEEVNSVLQRSVSSQSIHSDIDNASECQMSPLIYYNSESELDTPMKHVNKELKTPKKDVSDKAVQNKKSEAVQSKVSTSSSEDSDSRVASSSESIIQAGQVIPVNLNDSDDLFADMKSQELAVQEKQVSESNADRNECTPKKPKTWPKSQSFPSVSHSTRTTRMTSRISKTIRTGVYPEIKLEVKTTPKKNSTVSRDEAKSKTPRNERRLNETNNDRTSKDHADEESVSVFSSLIRQSGLRKRSASDVQIITQKVLSPITVRSSSSETKQDTKNGVNYPDDVETNFNSEMMSSPDLFNSINETLNEISNRDDLDESKKSDGHVNLNETEDEDFMAKLLEESAADKGSLSKLFNESKSKSKDIFEITKNNAFHNVLQVWSNTTISPIVETTPNTSVPKTQSCFSGLKISASKAPKSSNANDKAGPSAAVKPNKSKCIENKALDPVIDLTATSTPFIDSEKSLSATSSEEVKVLPNSPESETTPKRKRPLTPSTRSCLKRAAAEVDSPIGTRSMCMAKTDSPSKSKWLSKRTLDKVLTTSVTPKTRRSLKFTTPQSMKPRNILNQIDVQGNSRRAQQKRTRPGGTESPNIIFSSEED